nr:uncharacterized protein LOC112769445 [Arachis hypogaea]
MAEIWGMYIGVKLASELGIRTLVVESDSKCAITLTQKMSPEIHGNSSLIRSIKELLVKMEDVKVRHIYREANFCDDTLAKLGQEHELGIKFWEQPPPYLFHHLLADACGMKFSKIATGLSEGSGDETVERKAQTELTEGSVDKTAGRERKRN